jgi:hypothetical protein
MPHRISNLVQARSRRESATPNGWPCHTASGDHRCATLYFIGSPDLTVSRESSLGRPPPGSSWRSNLFGMR